MSTLPIAAPAAPSSLLPSGPGDRYFDYCLEPYEPRRPWRGKVRAENLLWHALEVGGLKDAFAEPLAALQRDVGRDMTVFGVKWKDGRLFYELYFYDPQKEDAAASASAIAKTLSPWIEIVPVIRESVPYMMASFELSDEVARTGRVERVNLYLTGEAVHAGRSYAVREKGTEFENTYRFLQAKPESDAILELLKSSYFVDYADPRTLSKILIPELFACKKICVSKKRTCDAIYYSGITVEQLRWFLGRFGYPEPIQAFVKTHEARLEHLYFDVGIDYRMDPSTGAITYPKSSYYGTI